MNEEVDEGTFYQEDFTTATEWEIFIARLEEIITEWRYKSEDYTVKQTSSGPWRQRSEKLRFSNINFTLDEYRSESLAEDDEEEPPAAAVDDFPAAKDPSRPLLHLAEWYNLKHFLLLSPTTVSINNESEMKILLSSLTIAISSTDLHVPAFVQIHNKAQNLYLGVKEADGLRVHYDMIHLRRVLPHCKYLSGVLDVFKAKIASSLPLEPAVVSVRLSYRLVNFLALSWSREMPDSLDFSRVFGTTVDPVAELVLHASWLGLPEHVVVDSENYSDFEPRQAPRWSVQVFTTEKPLGILHDCLQEFLQLLLCSALPFADQPASSQDISSTLDVLTESRVPTITEMVKKAAAHHERRRNSKITALIPGETLKTLLYYLFPDAAESPAKPYADMRKDAGDAKEKSFLDEHKIVLKTCPVDSLMWRLALAMAQTHYILGGARAFLYLWSEFVQEMRYRWNDSVLIPGLPPGSPDLRSCLLNQKLQMLNCCIERKKAREEASARRLVDSSSSSSSTDEEEFYDCCDNEDTDSQAPGAKRAPWNRPVGRLQKHPSLRLLKTGEPLYVPVTQEAVTKTEDELDEDDEALMNLGNDAQASELRAQMMSASLYSDMESFKAANPDGTLEDFMRWYSPRDWIEDEEEGSFDEWGQRKGRLSNRMLISDNCWLQMWTAAKPVPAARQKRLFDDTKEAEKILQWMESVSAAQIAQLLLPVLGHAAVHLAASEAQPVLHLESGLSVKLRHLCRTLERITRDPASIELLFEFLVRELAQVELDVCVLKSLSVKLPPAEVGAELVGALAAGLEVRLEASAKGPAGTRVAKMFSDVQNEENLVQGEAGARSSSVAPFPPAWRKEFVMRVTAKRPSAGSAATQQFMRAIVTKDEFRLAGAFAEDVVFSQVYH